MASPALQHAFGKNNRLRKPARVPIARGKLKLGLQVQQNDEKAVNGHRPYLPAQRLAADSLRTSGAASCPLKPCASAPLNYPLQGQARTVSGDAVWLVLYSGLATADCREMIPRMPTAGDHIPSITIKRVKPSRIHVRRAENHHDTARESGP